MFGNLLNISRPSGNKVIDVEEDDLLAHGGDTPTIKAVMLTTSDNPFNPFDDFDSWFRFDSTMNYNSCNYLARIAKTSDELSDVDNALAIELAVNEIVELNLSGIYKKVQRFISI